MNAQPKQEVTLARVEPQADTPSMLALAIEKGMPPEVIGQLITHAERLDSIRARKAFDQAISNAKAKIPVVVTNRVGHNSKRYADFAAFARVIDPIISEFGLSYRFRTTQDDRIHVTCVLSHREGHSEETTLAGPADATGNKNAIQAIGSTLTYLQRYSLKQALGLAASDDDDDGKAAGSGEPISNEQVKAIRNAITEVEADEGRFLKYLGVEKIEDIAAKDYGRAMSALGAKKKAATK